MEVFFYFPDVHSARRETGSVFIYPSLQFHGTGRNSIYGAVL